MRCSNKIPQKSKEETTIRGKFNSHALIALIVFDISSFVHEIQCNQTPRLCTVRGKQGYVGSAKADTRPHVRVAALTSRMLSGVVDSMTEVLLFK